MELVGAEKARQMYQLSIEALKILRQRIATHNIKCDAQDVGCLTASYYKADEKEVSALLLWFLCVHLTQNNGRRCIKRSRKSMTSLGLSSRCGLKVGCKSYTTRSSSTMEFMILPVLLCIPSTCAWALRELPRRQESKSMNTHGQSSLFRVSIS